jgi:hypothetical protein
VQPEPGRGSARVSHREVINQVASFRVADAMAAVLVGLPAEALA